MRSKEGWLHTQSAVLCCPDEYSRAYQDLLLMGSLQPGALEGVPVLSTCKLPDGCGSVFN